MSYKLPFSIFNSIASQLPPIFTRLAKQLKIHAKAMQIVEYTMNTIFTFLVVQFPITLLIVKEIPSEIHHIATPTALMTQSTRKRQQTVQEGEEKAFNLPCMLQSMDKQCKKLQMLNERRK